MGVYVVKELDVHSLVNRVFRLFTASQWRWCYSWHTCVIDCRQPLLSFSLDAFRFFFHWPLTRCRWDRCSVLADFRKLYVASSLSGRRGATKFFGISGRPSVRLCSRVQRRVLTSTCYGPFASACLQPQFWEIGESVTAWQMRVNYFPSTIIRFLLIEAFRARRQ